MDDHIDLEALQEAAEETASQRVDLAMLRVAAKMADTEETIVELDDEHRVNHISVVELRRVAGSLRGGEEVAIVDYRNKPVAILVPHPLDFWKDSRRLVAALVALRNAYLAPPYREEIHPWALRQTAVQTGVMEDLRRNTAHVFARLQRNVVFVLTYYATYQVMSLVPVPSDMQENFLQSLAQFIETAVSIPPAEDILVLVDPAKHEDDDT